MSQMKRYYWFIALLSIVSLGAIGANLAVQRDPQHDSRVVQDLNNLSSSVSGYWYRENRLPDSLAEVELSNPDVAARLDDYSYEPLSASSYQLCATFRTDSRGTTVAMERAFTDPARHAKGRDCFTYRLEAAGKFQ